MAVKESVTVATAMTMKIILAILIVAILLQMCLGHWRLKLDPFP